MSWRKINDNPSHAKKEKLLKVFSNKIHYLFLYIKCLILPSPPPVSSCLLLPPLCWILLMLQLAARWLAPPPLPPAHLAQPSSGLTPGGRQEKLVEQQHHSQPRPHYCRTQGGHREDTERKLRGYGNAILSQHCRYTTDIEVFTGSHKDFM